jgi:hypothetical protein
MMRKSAKADLRWPFTLRGSPSGASAPQGSRLRMTDHHSSDFDVFVRLEWLPRHCHIRGFTLATFRLF